MIKRPKVVHWRATMHHDYQGAFAAEKVDE
jgi:hypothetical protein